MTYFADREKRAGIRIHFESRAMRKTVGLSHEAKPQDKEKK